MLQPSSTFRIPFAVDHAEHLVAPEDADKKKAYRCAECGTEVILRAGSVRRKHFAHPIHNGCTPESALHKIAKRLIVQSVILGPKPTILEECSRCHGDCEHRFPEDVVDAKEEELLPSGRRADVALYDRSGALRAIVEVFYTHAVDDAKMQDVEKPVVEVKATDIIMDPLKWRTIRKLSKYPVCGACRDRIREEKEKQQEIQIKQIADEKKHQELVERFSSDIQRVSLAWKQPIIGIVGLYTCRCGAEILVYDPDDSYKSGMVPPTMQREDYGLYNTCPACGVLIYPGWLWYDVYFVRADAVIRRIKDMAATSEREARCASSG
jgi:hypothetical protein